MDAPQGGVRRKKRKALIGSLCAPQLSSKVVNSKSASLIVPKAQELCESRGGRPGCPVANSP